MFILIGLMVGISMPANTAISPAYGQSSESSEYYEEEEYDEEEEYSEEESYEEEYDSSETSEEYSEEEEYEEEYDEEEEYSEEESYEEEYDSSEESYEEECYDSDEYYDDECYDSDEYYDEDSDIICGDDYCDSMSGESCSNCGQDCGACPSICGDGACNSNESCSTCSADCGACREPCGNNVCNELSGEKCSNCPQDCGECKDIAPPTINICGDNVCQQTETKTSCPIDCAPVATVACGDNVCTGQETCGNCMQDCGFCTPARPADLTQVNTCGDNVCHILSEDCNSCSEDCGSCGSSLGNVGGIAISVKDARQQAERIGNLMQIDQSLAERISEKYAEQIQELKTREDDQVALSTKEKRQLVKLTSEIGKATRDEADEMRFLVAKGVLDNPTVLSLLYTLPGREDLMAAANSGDIETVIRLMPEGNADIAEISRKITVIEDGFPDIVEEIETNEEISLILKAFASHVGESEEEDVKIKFKRSVSLLGKMRAKAADPNEKLPDLEERLNYLIDRRNSISGIIGIASDNVENDLGKVKGEVRGTLTSGNPNKTEKLLNLSGIFEYIRSTANFETLEKRFTNAKGSMRSGMGKLIAIFTFGGAPEAEAAEILSEEGNTDMLQAVKEDNVEKQKESIRLLLSSNIKNLEPVLSKISEAEKQSFNEKIEAWQTKLDSAQTPSDMSVLLGELQTYLDETEAIAREKNGCFKRTMYFIHDFFGKN